MRRVLGKRCGARPGGGGVTSSTVVGGTHGSRPTTTHFVGQGPRALPWVRCDVGGRTEASAPTDDKEICASPGAGRCGERTERCRWQRKRSERVAAVKISSVRRKAAQKFWAPQQDHRPLRKRYKRCGEVWNPPVTAAPCQPPLGKGAKGTGDADCHGRGAHWLRNDRFFARSAVCGGTHGSRPTAEHFAGQGPRALPGSAVQDRRADRGVRPYGSATRGAMGGRPQGSPLRRGYKECDAVRNPPFLRPFKIIFSSLLLSMQRMCFSGHR